MSKRRAVIMPSVLRLILNPPARLFSAAEALEAAPGWQCRESQHPSHRPSQGVGHPGHQSPWPQRDEAGGGLCTGL